MATALFRAAGPLGGQIQGSCEIPALLCAAQSFLYLDLHREVLKPAHKVQLLRTSLVKSDYFLPGTVLLNVWMNLLNKDTRFGTSDL